LTQRQWDLIGYGVWTLIIWMTLKQFMQTRRPVKGRGLALLFGDWLLFAPLPWIIYCLQRATAIEIEWTIGMGAAVALPYILTLSFERTEDGTIRFKKSLFFYAILFSFPYIRYVIRTQVFKSDHIFVEGTHIPDIELMLALYIFVLVISTFLWRISLFSRFKILSKE
jgi:hypothetical protein